MNARVLRIVWAAIVISTILYAAIAYFTLHGYGRLDLKIKQPIVLGLYGAAIVMYFAAFLVSANVAPTNARQAFIVRLALLESVCVFGLVAAFLQHDWRLFLPTWVLSMFGFARSWPADEAL